jgi:hypothetical protein
MSVAIRYRASKSYAPTRNLVTYHQILFMMVFCCGYIFKQNFEPNSLYGRFLFPSVVKCFSLKSLGDLPFVQVIPMLFLVSHILAQSNKIWRHCIIAFLHCAIPYASSHKCVYNLEKECEYLRQSWMYLIQPCCHQMLSLASSGLLPPWSLYSTSSIGFTLIISHFVDHQVAPCLWRWPSLNRLHPIANLVNHPWFFMYT